MAEAVIPSTVEGFRRETLKLTPTGIPRRDTKEV